MFRSFIYGKADFAEIFKDIDVENNSVRLLK